MVTAILEGRKSQTRRVVKLQPSDAYFADALSNLGVPPETEYTPEIWYDGGVGRLGIRVGRAAVGFGSPNIRCPYGQPGDRLWVRETWTSFADQFLYRADAIKDDSGEIGGWWFGDSNLEIDRWRPSIHMPASPPESCSKSPTCGWNGCGI